MARFSTSLILFTLIRVLLTTLAILSSPLIFLIYALLSLYRWLISKIANYFDPQLGKLVASISCIFAAHNVYTNSYTINTAFHIAGHVDRHHIISKVKKLLETKTKNGQLHYIEMTQRLVQKFGFTFWKNVDNFQVEHHVRYLNKRNPDEVVTLQQLRNVIGRFGKTPFNPGRSPWEIFVVKNLVSDNNPEVKSAIIFRLHHCMFDGFGVLHFFSKLVDNSPLAMPGWSDQVAQPSRWWMRFILKPILIFFRGPYELIGQTLRFDNNQLIQTSRRHFKNKMRFHECDPVDLNELKMVKNYYKITMTSLLTGLIIVAVKRFLAKRNIRPPKIHMTFPLPVMNHPDKLRNYFSGGIFSFDLTHDDKLKLLRDIEKKYYEFRFTYASGLPEVSMMLLRVVGSLPSVLVPRIDNVKLSSTLMHTSVPGPSGFGVFCGFPVVDSTVGGSISKPYPIGTLNYSYNGMYKFGFMADESIFTCPEDAAEIGDYVMNEYKELRRCVIENDV